MRTFIPIVLASCLLLSCQRTKPQAPSRHSEQDSTKIAMLLLTQRIAEEADRELTGYVSHSEAEYVLDNTGFWYRYITRSDENRLQKGEKTLIRAQVYAMDGKLLLDSQEEVTVGKKETISAIDAMLRMMRKGEECELLVPWYMAFGATGSQDIPPYTNVKIELTTYSAY